MVKQTECTQKVSVICVADIVVALTTKKGEGEGAKIYPVFHEPIGANLVFLTGDVHFMFEDGDRMRGKA